MLTHEVNFMISARFRAAVRAFPGRQWQLAHRANLHPTVLSKIMTGEQRVRFGDERVLRVREVLGLAASECFETEPAAVA
jgi:hypothetical protein